MTQLSLLDFVPQDHGQNAEAPIALDLPDGEVIYYPRFFARKLADTLFTRLIETIPWKQDVMWMFGRQMNLPRLTSWHGDPNTGYTYSGITNVPVPWTMELNTIRYPIETATQVLYNSVLLNRYRNGTDSVGMHSDDEPVNGFNPVIASVSLGATRTFQLQHKTRRDLKVRSVDLAHGDLLVMRGATQTNWKHGIPKTTKPVGERINLTFRLVETKPT